MGRLPLPVLSWLMKGHDRDEKDGEDENRGREKETEKLENYMKECIC